MVRALLLVGLLAWAAPALPCELLTRAADFVVPADGTPGVPVDVTPFAAGADLELSLHDGAGNTIPATIEDMVLTGVGGADVVVRRALPLGDLAPSTDVLVLVDGSVQSTFTVGAAPTAAPPVGPEAALAGVTQGQGAVGDCGSYATIGIASDDAAFFIGVVDGQPTVGARARWDGASAGDELVVFAEGKHTVNVAGVDFAGRVGAAVPVEIEVPAALACACASTRASTSTSARAAGVALAVALVAGLRRRRPARPRELACGEQRR